MEYDFVHVKCTASVGRILAYSIMDFTELYKHSAGIVAFSPGAHFKLNAVHDVLVVRRTDTLQITRTWSIPDAISHAGWSCDSEYLFAASAKAAVVHVFKLRDDA